MTPMRRSLWLLATMLVASGCSFLLSFEKFGECRDGACIDSVDGGVQEAAAVCTPYKWPTLTEATTGASQPRRVYAVQTIAFGSAQDAGLPAYDINNRCVCPGGTRGQASCTLPSGGKVACDDFLNGADDRFAGLFGTFRNDQTVAGFTDIEATKGVQDGKFTLLIQVDDYNGLANDSTVAVSLYNAIRVDSDAGASDDAGLATDIKPTFDPAERWVADKTFLRGTLTTSNIVSDGAYVANSTLVAEFQNAELGLFLRRTGRFTLKLRDVRFVMAIPSEPQQPTRASFVGRIPVSEILLLGGKLGWCPNAIDMNDRIKAIGLSSAACSGADVNAAGDDTGNAPCDAVSTNMQFALVPSQAPARSELGTYDPSKCPEATCP
jgi:hypothetical protein